jgi:hypothetical protein
MKIPMLASWQLNAASAIQKLTLKLGAWWHGLPSHWSMPSLIVIAVVYISAITLMHTQATSPIDEWLYIDYLSKIPEQAIVLGGEHVGTETLIMMSCHGTSPFGPIGTPCGLNPVYADYPNLGKTTANGYTPLFFYVTFAWGWVVTHLFPVSELVAWRFSGVGWLVLTVFFLVKIMRIWGVREWAIFALGLAFVASPFSWWTYTYISTDAPSVAAGALLAYVALRFLRSNRPGWPLVLVSITAVLLKSINIVAVAAIAVYAVAYVVTTWWSSGRSIKMDSRPKKFLLWSFCALLGGSAVAVAWDRIARALVIGEPVDQGIATPLSIAELLMQLTNFLPGTIVASGIEGYTPTWVFAPLSWVCITAVIGGAFVTLRGEPAGPWVQTTLVSTLLAAPALALMFFSVSGSYFQIPGRYGASLLPFILVSAGLLLRSRWMSGVIVLYSMGIMGLGLWLSGYLATLAP